MSSHLALPLPCKTDRRIENAAPHLVITAIGFAIENAKADSAGELKCKIVM